MPIREQDIHIVQSQVMADVPEGGGAPTAHVVADGASNAIFADVTDVDRVRGAVSLAKVFSVVATPDTDRLMGQFWAALQPSDPQVSVSLPADPGGFSRRVEAADRMAAYLHSGPAFNGYLLERHIRGMRQIQLFCHPSTEPPPVGRTLYLVQHEGEAREVSQYVRARPTTPA